MTDTTWPLSAHATRKSEILWIAIALPVLFRVGLWTFFGADFNLATQQDNTYQLAPIFSELSRSFHHGDFPYWMRSVLAGLPLYNDPDFSPAYPFYFLFFNIYATPLAAMKAIHAVTLLHLFVMYVNTYILLRCLRARPLAAVLGASLFAFSHNSMSYAEWINITASYAWLPLVLASVVLILDRRQTGRPVLFGTVAFALLVLASPSQSLIHAIYVIGVLFAWRAAAWIWDGEFAALREASADLALMAIGTFIAASPALVPALLNLDGMIRFLGDLPPIVGRERIPFDGMLVGQLAPSQLASVLLPLRVPVIVGSWFIGLGAVLFALVAVMKFRRAWIIAPLTLVTAFALMSAMGSHLGVAQINYHLPFINMIREPPRHMVIFMLGAASLAGLGFDYVTALVSRGQSHIGARHVLFPAAAILLAFAAWRSPLAYVGVVPMWVPFAAFAATLGLLGVALWSHGSVRSLLFGTAAAVIIAANFVNPAPPWRLTTNDYFRPANLASHQTLAELSRIDDIRQYRVIFEGDELKPWFWSMNASYYDIRSFQAFKNPISSARQYDEVFNRLKPGAYYPLLGGKYYLCRLCDHVDTSVYRFDRLVNGHKLYVADSAVGPYTVIGRVAGLYDTPGDFLIRARSKIDFSQEAYLNQSVSVPALESLLRTKLGMWRSSVREEARTPNSVTMSVGTDHDAILLLNEYYTEAWKATVNGRSVTPFPVNLNQVGVALAPGGSLVTFTYRPTTFVWLLRVELVMGLLLLMYLGQRGWRAWAGARARRAQR